METIIQKINRAQLEQEDFSKAAHFLQEGELVAFPTETVYGLGGDALDETAAHRIYAAKGRPSDNPLIVHIASVDALDKLAVNVPKEAYVLADAFWPGPLTMILNKSAIVPHGTTGGLDTVAIRMPSDPIALKLILESNVYIAAPSANLSGRPSPTKAEHVIEDMQGRIAMILDGGAVPIGIESTIVDLTGDKPLILRPGFVTKEKLEAVLTQVDYDPAVIARTMNKNVVAKAPGMKYRHYAPKAELTIFEGEADAVVGTINQRTKQLMEQGHQVGIIATDETKARYEAGVVKSIGSRSDEQAIAAHLFAMLREFDELDVSFICSESFDDNPLGQAIMNRLLKAAGYQIMKCS